MKKRNLVLVVLLIVSVISPSLFGDVLYEQPVNWDGGNAYLIVSSSGNDYIFHEPDPLMRLKSGFWIQVVLLKL